MRVGGRAGRRVRGPVRGAAAGTAPRQGPQGEGQGTQGRQAGAGSARQVREAGPQGRQAGAEGRRRRDRGRAAAVAGGRAKLPAGSASGRVPVPAGHPVLPAAAYGDPRHVPALRGLGADGKASRGARVKGQEAPQHLGFFWHGTRLNAAQRAVDRKTNETTVIGPVIDGMDLTGVCLTADALHSLADLGKRVLARGGHVIFVIRNLNDQLANGPWDSWDVVWRDLGRPLLRALAHAHLLQIEHRDIKPSNVLIDGSGAPLLADFGIAKIRGDDQPQSELTVVGFRSGAYAPPEMEAKMPYVRDVYSVGVLLLQCLSKDKILDFPDIAPAFEVGCCSARYQEDPQSLQLILNRVSGRATDLSCLPALTKRHDGDCQCARQVGASSGFGHERRCIGIDGRQLDRQGERPHASGSFRRSVRLISVRP